MDKISQLQNVAADLPPQVTLLQMITSNWVAQSVYAAAKLGLADYFHDQAKHYKDLAREVGAFPDALYRLLRALSSLGIFAETDPGCFILTPLAECLKSDVPDSLRDVSIMMGDPEHYNSWGNILHCLKTGESAFAGLFGMNVFQYYNQYPEPAAIFDRAMTSFSTVENPAIAAAYDFSSMTTIADIGGGQGSLLAAILAANPGTRGILFDQTDAIARATASSEPTFRDRCELISGDFFASVPSHADAYILKHILHDWDDERSIAILKNCRQVMHPASKLLVVEMVIESGNAPAMCKLLDVNMLVMCPGGKERTEVEYRELYAAAGFQLTRIISTASLVSIIEGSPMSQIQ